MRRLDRVRSYHARDPFLRRDGPEVGPICAQRGPVASPPGSSEESNDQFAASLVAFSAAVFENRLLWGALLPICACGAAVAQPVPKMGKSWTAETFVDFLYPVFEELVARIWKRLNNSMCIACGALAEHIWTWRQQWEILRDHRLDTVKGVLLCDGSLDPCRRKAAKLVLNGAKCFNCHCFGPQGSKMKMCSRCLRAAYCSADCQNTKRIVISAAMSYWAGLRMLNADHPGKGTGVA